jgi:hypothetical protein
MQMKQDDNNDHDEYIELRKSQRRLAYQLFIEPECHCNKFGIDQHILLRKFEDWNSLDKL